MRRKKVHHITVLSPCDGCYTSGPDLIPAWMGDACVKAMPALHKGCRRPGSSLTYAEQGIAVPGDGLDAEDPEGEQDEEIEDETEHVAEEPGEGPTEEGPEEKPDDDTTPAPAEVEVTLSLLSICAHSCFHLERMPISGALA